MPPPKKTLTVHLIGILETAGLRVSDQVCGKYIHSHKSKEKLKNKSEVEQDGNNFVYPISVVARLLVFTMPAEHYFLRLLKELEK